MSRIQTGCQNNLKPKQQLSQRSTWNIDHNSYFHWVISPHKTQAMPITLQDLLDEKAKSPTLAEELLSKLKKNGKIIANYEYDVMKTYCATTIFLKSKQSSVQRHDKSKFRK